MKVISSLLHQNYFLGDRYTHNLNTIRTIYYAIKPNPLAETGLRDFSCALYLIEHFCYNGVRTVRRASMFIQIEPNSDIPIYAQLSFQLIEAIASGKLKDGDTLPSVRSLASDLGMNMHTVNKAYHELEKKGIIRIVPKSGAVIDLTLKNRMSNEDRLRLAEEFKPIIAEAIVLGMEKEDISNLILTIISDVKGE